MIINGREYRFAYTVEAFLALNDLKLGTENTPATNIRNNMVLGVLLSSAYEHRQKVLDPTYEEHPLTKDEISTLTMYQMSELVLEVESAMKAGTEQTVELKIPKKKVEENHSNSTKHGSFFMARFLAWMKRKLSR